MDIDITKPALSRSIIEAFKSDIQNQTAAYKRKKIIAYWAAGMLTVMAACMLAYYSTGVWNDYINACVSAYVFMFLTVYALAYVLTADSISGAVAAIISIACVVMAVFGSGLPAGVFAVAGGVAGTLASVSIVDKERLQNKTKALFNLSYADPDACPNMKDWLVLPAIQNFQNSVQSEERRFINAEIESMQAFYKLHIADFNTEKSLLNDVFAVGEVHENSSSVSYQG